MIRHKAFVLLLLSAMLALPAAAAQPAPDPPPAPATTSDPAPPAAPTTDDEGSRVVRGTPAEVGSSPWQIGIYTTIVPTPREIAADARLPHDHPDKEFLDRKTVYERDHVCGGALIAPDWALTAAHCFYSRAGKLRALKDRRVRLGHVALTRSTEMAIERVVVHAGFVPGARNRAHDIALVKLRPDARTNPAIAARAQPVPMLAPGDPPPMIGDRLLVTGWGVTTQNEAGENLDYRNRPKRGSLVLLEGIINPVDAARCRAVDGLRPVMSDRVLCAGSAAGQDSCQGDSGGPLTREGVLVALVRSGVGCGIIGRPAIYTLVAPYADWIRAAMAQSPPRCVSRFSLDRRRATCAVVRP
jgi:secreted trypsin-like serine protease